MRWSSWSDMRPEWLEMSQISGRSAHDDFLSFLDCSLNQPQHGRAAGHGNSIWNWNVKVWRNVSPLAVSSSITQLALDTSVLKASRMCCIAAESCSAVWLCGWLCVTSPTLWLGESSVNSEGLLTVWQKIIIIIKMNLTEQTIKYLCLHLIMILEPSHLLNH